MAVTPEQLGLLLRYQRYREEAGAATQEKLSMQIQERKLLEPERKDCGIFSFPRSLRAAGSFFTLSVQGATQWLGERALWNRYTGRWKPLKVLWGVATSS